MSVMAISLGLQQYIPDFVKTKERKVIHEEPEDDTVDCSTTRMATVLGYIFLNPRISRQELMEAITREVKVSQRTIHTAIKALEEKNLIKKTVMRLNNTNHHYYEVNK